MVPIGVCVFISNAIFDWPSNQVTAATNGAVIPLILVRIFMGSNPPPAKRKILHLIQEGVIWFDSGISQDGTPVIMIRCLDGEVRQHMSFGRDEGGLYIQYDDLSETLHLTYEIVPPEYHRYLY